MLQVIETRILSVVSWYHLAFFVISVAMFGLTSGAVWVYLRGELFTARLDALAGPRFLHRGSGRVHGRFRAP